MTPQQELKNRYKANRSKINRAFFSLSEVTDLLSVPHAKPILEQLVVMLSAANKNRYKNALDNYPLPEHTKRSPTRGFL